MRASRPPRAAILPAGRRIWERRRVAGRLAAAGETPALLKALKLGEQAGGTVSATFAGSFLHETIFEMAAAYLYHLSRNHPFVDGNKRTALAAALTFLHMNGVRIEASEDELVELSFKAAAGDISKAEVAVFLQNHESGRTG